jgi:hypothetical protein
MMIPAIIRKKALIYRRVKGELVCAPKQAAALPPTHLFNDDLASTFFTNGRNTSFDGSVPFSDG